MINAYKTECRKNQLNIQKIGYKNKSAKQINVVLHVKVKWQVFIDLNIKWYSITSQAYQPNRHPLLLAVCYLKCQKNQNNRAK